MLDLNSDWVRLPPAEAIDWFARKMRFSTEQLQSLTKLYDDQVFTVAGLEDDRLLEAARQGIEDALKSGGTLTDFKKSMDAAFSAAGVDPLDPWHLETVFRTNLGQAYNAGAKAQGLDPAVMEALPFWAQQTAGDGEVRPEHERFALDHPTWPKTDEALTAESDAILNKINCRCIRFSTATAEG